MNSNRCPQCGLVNFADAEVCKRCGATLSVPAAEASTTAPAAELSQQAPRPFNPNLYPCPDCGHMVSRQAEACPQCGRFFQRFKMVVDRSGWAGTIALGILLIFILFVLLNVLLLVLLVGSRR